MSFSETIFLFFLALVIFGPKKLPEIARQAGKLLNEFRRASNEFKSQIEQEIAHLEVEEKKKTDLPPAMPPPGTASRTLNAAMTDTAALEPTASPSLSAASVTASASGTEDEPLFANSASTASETAETAETVRTAPAPLPTRDADRSTPQESHV